MINSCNLSIFNKNSNPKTITPAGNCKSTYKGQLCYNSDDLKSISKKSHSELRRFLPIWDEEKGRYVCHPRIYFTNYIAFDLDIDEKHFPNSSDERLSKILEISLAKLYRILGTPKWIIKNKSLSELTESQISTYFTEINSETGEKKINIPKKYGCQVFYELTESIQSVYPERYNIFETVRKTISAMIGADPNFNCNMAKNPLNKEIFNIWEAEEGEDSKVDILNLALNGYAKYCYREKETKNIIVSENNLSKDLILKKWNCEKNKTIDELSKPDLHLRKYINSLFNFYNELNSWKFDDSRIDYMINNNYAEKTQKDSSRNVTLFNYFKYIPINKVQTITYKEILSIKGLFDSCTIKENLDEEEVERIRTSVLGYYNLKNENIDRNNHTTKTDNDVNCNILNENHEDVRVFKFNQSLFDRSFFKNNKSKFYSGLNRIKNLFEIEKNIPTSEINPNLHILYKYWAGFKSEKMPIILYNMNFNYNDKIVNNNYCKLENIKKINNNNKTSIALANIFLSFGPETILSNIRNLFSQEMIDFIKDLNKIINYNDNNNTFGINDVYFIIKNAIFYTHFKYYREIQIFREEMGMKKKINIGEVDSIKYFEQHENFFRKLCKNKKSKLDKKNFRLQKNFSKYGVVESNKYINKKYLEYLIGEKLETSIVNSIDNNALSVVCFAPYYSRIESRGNFLKSNGTAKTVSFYRSELHCSNALACALRRTINRYRNFINKFVEILNINKIKTKNFINYINSFYMIKENNKLNNIRNSYFKEYISYINNFNINTDFTLNLIDIKYIFDSFYINRFINSLYNNNNINYNFTTTWNF